MAIENIGHGRRIKIFSFALIATIVIVVAFYFTQCKRDRYIPAGYVVISATQAVVAKYTPDEPEHNIIYAVDPSPAGASMITAVAYDPVRAVLAIGITNKEPKKGSAKIVLQDYNTSLPLSVIKTDKDRILGLSFGRNGEIAFTTGNVNLNLPGELCIIERPGGPVRTVAEGKFFGKPSWNKDSRRIYFSYRMDSEKAVGYVDLGKPGVITKIAEGLSVTVSDGGKIAYLTLNGEVVFHDEASKVQTVAKLTSEYGDKFTDRIWFVKGTEDIILQRYAFSVVYDLFIFKPPYTDVMLMVPYIGMQDFDVACIKGCR